MLDLWAPRIRARFPDLPTEPAMVLRTAGQIMGRPVTGGDPSGPFSNGSEYRGFLEHWCETCRHYVPWDAHPEWAGDDPRLCPIETAMAGARFDPHWWPRHAVRTVADPVTGGLGWVCLAYAPAAADARREMGTHEGGDTR